MAVRLCEGVWVGSGGCGLSFTHLGPHKAPQAVMGHHTLACLDIGHCMCLLVESVCIVYGLGVVDEGCFSSHSSLWLWVEI